MPSAVLSTSDLAVLVVHGAVFVLSLLGLLRSAAPRHLRQLTNAVRAIGRALCSWKCVDNDEMAAEVEKIIRQDKVNHMRKFCYVCAVGAMPVTVSRMYLFAKGQGCESLLREIAVLVFTGVCMATLHCSSMVSWRSIDGVYLVQSLSWSLVALSPATSGEGGGMKIMVLMFVPCMAVATMSMLRRDLYIVAPTNAIFALSACTTLWHAGSGSMQPMCMSICMWAVMLIASVSSRFFDNWSRATVCEGLRMNAAKQLLGAATALLRSTCDMVIETDAEGTIIGHARELGSFLLRGPSYSLQGYLLTDLMVREDDRQAFLAGLHADREEGMNLAEAIHVRMRDANSTILSLQLLFFRFAYIDGTSRFMVGIRGNFPALGERERGNEAPGDRSPAAPLPPPTRVGASRVAPAGEDVISELSDAHPVVLVVDAMDPAFPVRECSIGFRTRIGRLPAGTGLTDVVKHGANFEAWIHHALNSISYAMPAPADHTLLLYMPHGQVTATCKVLKIDNWYDAEGGHDGPPVWGDEEDPEIESPNSTERRPIRRVELLFSEISHRLNSSHQPRWRLPSASALMHL